MPRQNLLLLHGALGSKNQFAPLKKRLESDFEIHTFNFEGHGGRESSKEFSIELFTENAITFLNENSIDKVHIFGYSMGGYVALNTALKIPNQIDKIITLGTKFDWSVASAEREVKMLNPDKIEEKIPQFAGKLKREHHPQDWKEVVNKTAQMMLKMGSGAKLKDEDFKKVQQPVVIGIGGLDTMVTYEESENISKLLPNSKLIRLEGVKHPIDTIDTEELVGFIKSNVFL